MSTVDDAADAGALALAKLYEKRVPHKADELASDAVLQAAWPVLSARLREMHPPICLTSIGGEYIGCTYCTDECDTAAWIIETDRGLGL